MVVFCRKLRRGSTIGAAMVSAAMLWALPSANASSGGGCLKSSAQGFTITSCISARNSTVIPDYFVDAVPDLKGQPCYIQPVLFVNKFPKALMGSPQACVPGHQFTIDQPSQSGNYYLEVRVVIGNNLNRRLILNADSPMEFN
jgi:hypothetical protein